MYFYIQLILHVIVHCEWGEWIIGECSEECGEGTRTNTRTLKVPSDDGGKKCDGPSSFVETCTLQDCSGITNLVHLGRCFTKSSYIMIVIVIDIFIFTYIYEVSQKLEKLFDWIEQLLTAQDDSNSKLTQLIRILEMLTNVTATGNLDI